MRAKVARFERSGRGRSTKQKLPKIHVCAVCTSPPSHSAHYSRLPHPHPTSPHHLPHRNNPPQHPPPPKMPSHPSPEKATEANAASSQAARGALSGATKWGLATAALGLLAYASSPLYRGLTVQFKVYVRITPAHCPLRPLPLPS